MGCAGCKNQPNPSNQPEIALQPGNPEPYDTQAFKKESILNDILAILKRNDFTSYQFEKKTSHSLEYHRNSLSWTQASSKKLNILGIVSPFNLQKLKQANEELKVLKDQQQSSEVKSIIIDQNMEFQCALRCGDPLPNLYVNYTNQEEKTQLKVQSSKSYLITYFLDKFTIIRSWNLGEKMLNFERMVDFVQTRSQQYPELKVDLIGLFRANDSQISQFMSTIEGNNWSSYNHIQLIIEEASNEGWYFDVDYVEKRNTIIKGNNLSCCLIDSNGTVLWKRYENEWSFCSDADEVEQELGKILIEKQVPQQPKDYLDVFKEEQVNFPQESYRKLKKLVKSGILESFKEERFSRTIRISIQKQSYYKSEEERVIQIMEPEIRVESSKKSYGQTQRLLEMVQGQHTRKVEHVQWNKELLDREISQLVKQHDLNVQMSLDKIARIVITPMEINSFISPWEQSPIIPYYPSTDFIFNSKSWLTVRETLLPQLQELKASEEVKSKINEMKFNFFRQIPGVSRTLNEKFGLIPYVERRKPPYEDIATSQGAEQSINRNDNQILLVFLIDYENDDSLSQLQNLIALKENNFPNLQIVVLGHIRAESWTRLFQAFIEKQGLQDPILNNVIETWFPVEDKISSVSFLAIVGRIYGMILEKRDCMIVDQHDRIRYLDSSRRCVPNLEKILQDIKSTNAVEQPNETQKYKNEWYQMKKFIRENNKEIEEMSKQLQKTMEDDDEMIVIEQKQNKITTFSGQKNSEDFIRVFNKPIIKIKGCSKVKEGSKQLLNKMYQYISAQQFEMK